MTNVWTNLLSGPHKPLERRERQLIATIRNLLVQPVEFWTGLEGLDEALEISEVKVSALLSVRLLQQGVSPDTTSGTEPY